MFFALCGQVVLMAPVFFEPSLSQKILLLASSGGVRKSSERGIKRDKTVPCLEDI